MDCCITEDTQKIICAYCKRNVEAGKFESEFDYEKHYKTQRCPHCSRELRIKVDFDGSGHDCWNGNEPKIRDTKAREKIRVIPLEEKIQVIEKAVKE